MSLEYQLDEVRLEIAAVSPYRLKQQVGPHLQTQRESHLYHSSYIYHIAFGIVVRCRNALILGLIPRLMDAQQGLNVRRDKFIRSAP
jgi:hypothetical protein